jgi:hypothetical protein
MASFPSPELNLDYVCITPKDSAVVSALISSYFNQPGIYFIVLTFPDLEIAYKPGSSLREDDDYFAQTMGAHAALRINNAIARLHPTKIFLAGMNEAQKSYIRARIPERFIIELDNIQDIERMLASVSNSPGETVFCRSSEIIQGLAVAKYANKRLSIDEAAPSPNAQRTHRGAGLVLIENNGTSDEVVAVNYAFSIGADIALVKPFERSDLHPLQKLIYEWKIKGSDFAYQQLRRALIERTDGINFYNYQFATFFTLGFPYGMLLNNMIPFTHVFIHPGCDLFIVNNIGSELFPGTTGSALVFSPRLFEREETDGVIRILEQNSYLVRVLLGKRATVNALAHYGEYFPYDLMHICSHGGETDGYYVIQEFLDRTGQMHKLEYEEIVGFSPADEGTVAVVRKILFRQFDGFPWMSEELKKLPKYVFDDMAKALPIRKDGATSTKRNRVDTPIYASCHIECTDSIHQGQFHSLACNSHPIIFNNTCSSWYEIAITFIAAGARAYLGTIWRVDNFVAREAAKVFYEQLLSQENLLDAFYEMTRAIQPVKYRNIYLYWGLHFSKIKSPMRKPDQEVFNVLVASLIEWQHEYDSATNHDVRRQCLRVLRFLVQEMKTNFTPMHLVEFKADLAARLAIAAQLSDKDDLPDDDITERGVIDL